MLQWLGSLSSATNVAKISPNRLALFDSTFKLSDEKSEGGQTCMSFRKPRHATISTRPGTIAKRNCGIRRLEMLSAKPSNTSTTQRIVPSDLIHGNNALQAAKINPYARSSVLNHKSKYPSATK